MATKNDPGKFDCYAHAEPDEPMFILLGRDPTASFVVAFWQELRKAIGKNQTGDAQMRDAANCQKDMLAWSIEMDKRLDTVAAYEAYNKLLGRP